MYSLLKMKAFAFDQIHVFVWVFSPLTNMRYFLLLDEGPVLEAEAHLQGLLISPAAAPCSLQQGPQACEQLPISPSHLRAHTTHTTKHLLLPLARVA